MTNYHYGVCNLKCVYHARLELEIPLIVKNSELYGQWMIGYVICLLSSTLHSPYSLFAAIVKVVYFLNAPAPSSPFSLFSHYCWAPRGSSLLVPSAQNINTQLSVKGSTYLRSFVECWSQQMPHHQHTWLAKNIMPRMNVFLKIGASFCPKKWILFFSKD